jgi:transglutaminase-like putative cysteine protease
MLKTLALSSLAALVIAVNWLRFEEPRADGGRAFLLVALAIAPMFLRPLWLRLAGIAVAVVLGLWVALSASPLALRPGGDSYFGPLVSRFGGGVGDFYEFKLPFDPAEHVAMHEVILVAIFGFTLASAVAISQRRVVPALLIFLVGAGWPATLLAGGNELGRGVVILAVALALLAGLVERPSRLALGASAAVLVGALALSSSPAVAKDAFFGWENWDFYTRAQNPVSVRYVWNAQYDGVSFPKRKTTVLTIEAPRRSQYWRATVLDRFDGTRWVERLWRESPAEARVLSPKGAGDEAAWLGQEITVRAFDDDHLVGATVPVAHDAGSVVSYEGQGVLRAVDGFERDEHYRVWSFAARPTPEQLASVKPAYPAALTKRGRELDVGAATLPAFGAPDRDLRVSRLLTGRLQPYAQLYARARSVAGETASPYAAVVALEAWFRSTGGFSYSERPRSIPGMPPLVGFVVETKNGYCQHFAGAMATMLRLLGIPARVAVGFSPGHYRQGEWRVTDHEAHAWVEVWFKGYGWLPFDPTPGRARISGTYSSTALGFNAEAAARLLSDLVDGGEVFGQTDSLGIIGHDPNRRTPRTTGDRPFGLGLTPAPAPEERGPSLLWFLFLLAAGLAAAIVLVKHARRGMRYLTRDPRRIAGACARELSEYLQDQRLVTAGTATVHELGSFVTARLGIDASRFTRAATAARYGRPDDAAGEARAARRELRELKRKLRRGLAAHERLRGLVSVRSLGLG